MEARTTGRFPCEIQPAQRSASSSGRGTTSVDKTTPKIAKNVYVEGSRAPDTHMVWSAAGQPAKFPSGKKKSQGIAARAPIARDPTFLVVLGLGYRRIGGFVVFVGSVALGRDVLPVAC